MMHRSNRGWRQGAALLLALSAGGQLHAAGCSVSSSGLAFGAYHPLVLPGKLSSVAVTSSASISVVCTGIVGGGSYSIALGASTAGGGDGINTRYLANPNGGDYMKMNVYREPAYSTVWGDGITAGDVLSGTLPPGDSNQSHAVYGRIAAGQNTLRAGSYSDTLTMTLTYSP